MTKDEAMQMALDALELHAKQYPHMQKGYTVDAIEALRAALAQPDKEWVNLTVEEREDLRDLYQGNCSGLISVVQMMLKEKNND